LQLYNAHAECLRSSGLRYRCLRLSPHAKVRRRGDDPRPPSRVSRCPAFKRNKSPNRLNHAERPGALQKAINGRQCARHREGKHIPMAPVFKRIEDQHCRNGEQAEKSQPIRHGSCRSNLGKDRLP
jgi:hypothetical protein